MRICLSAGFLTKGRKNKSKSCSKILPATTPETLQMSDKISQLIDLKRYQFSELEEAKGWIDGNVVRVEAVDLKGHKKWLENIRYRGQLSHPNVLKLIGFCSEDDHLHLVYEYMYNGSLNDHIRGIGVNFQQLPWGLYMKAILGAAKGLAFLHHEAEMIYEDFKASNILLDLNYNAKLSHVGLMEDTETCDKSRFYVRFLETAGYAAPENISTCTLTRKCNVYSFGIVLLEIITGKPAIYINRPSEDESSEELGRSLVNAHVPHLVVSDQHLKIDVVIKVAQLAFECVSVDLRLRPDMKDVVQALEQLH
ncbi:Protein kinase superfamily protein [Euphorbia peplus]|nr:Protein kinase superfamily protein [Euphorbia peplus]